MTYETEVGERICDEIDRNRITSEYKIDLEERAIYIQTDSRYQHFFETQLYGIRDNKKRRLWKKPLKYNEYFSDEGTSVTKNTLEAVVTYLKKNKLRGRRFEFIGPTSGESKHSGTYRGTLIINVS
ncbi:MAG: hypothetical protein KKB79_03005 [Nanoarchaeota archaeon]|nr:hypothetical protein [Nanoarchaeota archaeon]MBU1501775.1 hypothetical protein [Nanoarchaeota archaeon]MBU2458885.1 hypothetical protein [Nanoarchaeota archaeon]MBU2616921.1 hypothetical protein [Nanoarchaeota archaeon]